MPRPQKTQVPRPPKPPKAVPAQPGGLKGAGGPLTVAEVAKAVPAHLKTAVTASLVGQLNTLQVDPQHAEAIRDNFLSYTKVLGEGRFKLEDYLYAVKYVSFKLMGYTNQDAYLRTFPDRHEKMREAGRTSQEISSYVSIYAKGKLVNLILEQSMIPTWVLNQDTYQQAINTQADLMLNANSEMVRMQAANSILQHLKKPDAVGPLINIDQRDMSGISELTGALNKLAESQLKALQSGATTLQISASKISTKDES